VKVSGDQLNDVRKPVLSDWSDHIDRDLVVYVLTVALIGDFASLNAALVGTLGVHQRLIFLTFIGGLNVLLADYV
jgi:hypothetical protein